MTLRVKICGLTRIDEAKHTVDAGADAIGLVFVPTSKRTINIECAKDIVAALPSLINVVGLAMNPDKAEWQRLHHIAQRLPINLWQFHGEESVSDLSMWTTPFIKVIRVVEDTEGFIRFQQSAQDYEVLPLCRGFLLDAGAGDGVPIPWAGLSKTLNALPAHHPLIKKPFILAGGLTPNNINEALHHLHRWISAVDVSSGVESSPGRKSPELVQTFIQATKRFSF